jgi:TolB-like protein
VPARWIALSLSLLAAAAAHADDPAAPARKRLVVLDLRPIGVEKPTADLLSEVALTEAARYRSLQVIGQSDLGAMLSLERQKQLLGCREDSGCMTELAGALGADLMLFGSLGQLGQLRRLDLSLVDAQKARVLDRFGETIEGQEDRLIAGVQRGVRALLTPLAGEPTTAQPAEEAPRGDTIKQSKFTSVESGQEVLVNGHKNWKPGCKPAPLPFIRITRQPEHGAVELRRGTFVITQSWNKAADLSCIGKKVPGLGLYYRAGEAFHGEDAFRYELVSGVMKQQSFDFEVRVSVP